MNTAMAIVLDASGSVNASQWQLMLDGYSRGLASPEVIQAIVADGGMAVCVIHYDDSPVLVIEWRRLATEQDVHRFASDFRAMERQGYLSTATGTAILMATRQLAPMNVENKLINISTDGPSNYGFDPRIARDQAQSMDIRINCVGIITQTGDPTEWLEENIKTEDGFVVVANGWQDFQRAIKRKLVMELS